MSKQSRKGKSSPPLPPNWTSQSLKLPKNHGWVSKPGYKIFVADRGAVRFDFPENWIVTPGPDSIRFHDKEPPDDDCILQVSVHRLPPEIDFSGLPVQALLEALPDDDDDERKTLGRGKVQLITRPDLDFAWYETRFLDVKQSREAIGRVGLGRAKNIQPLITFDFWPEHLPHLDPVWNEVLRSLQIGNFIADPTRHYLH